MLVTIVTLLSAIVFTSCSNEDNSVIPVSPDDTPVAQEWNHDHEYVPFVEEGKVIVIQGDLQGLITRNSYC